MLSIEDYISKESIHFVSAYRRVSSGCLLSVKVNGRTYIVEHGNLKEYPRRLLTQIKHAVEGNIDEMIKTASVSAVEKKRAIKEIRTIVERWEYEGLKLKSGYSEKSLYRKLQHDVSRKKRSDAGIVKNIILRSADKADKLRSIAYSIYLKNARPNINVLCDFILKYARENEEYYEFASLPKSTLYKFLAKDMQAGGIKHVHFYLNHKNLFHSQLPNVSGAFTDGAIKFMDYIYGDDHKADVAKVFVWDKIKKTAYRKAGSNMALARRFNNVSAWIHHKSRRNKLQ